MFVLSYVALGLWILFALISVLIFSMTLLGSMAVGSSGGILYAVAGLLLNGFIIYAAYNNIIHLGKCRELMLK